MPDAPKCVICGNQLTPERIAEDWASCEKCEDKLKHWLDPQELMCPTCSKHLFSVIHSPYYDEHFLYCDSCPRFVAVDFYDPALAPIRKRHKVDAAEGSDWEAYFDDLESHLNKCPCGGTFRDTSPRRCPYCSTVIPGLDRGRDISAKDENFDFDSLVIKKNIWKK